MGMAAATLSGYETAHSKACMPPIDPPATASKRSMPRKSTRLFCTRTMSPMVITGNDRPNGQPVCGLTDDGPVVPWQPPSTFEQIMKYFSVSNALPGPIMLSHQPGFPVSWLIPAACASPENACRMRIALDFDAFNAP